MFTATLTYMHWGSRLSGCPCSIEFYTTFLSVKHLVYSLRPQLQAFFLHCDHDVSPHLTKSMSFAKETWAKQPMWYRLRNRTMLSISSCHPCFWCFTSNVSIVSVQNSPHLFVDLYTALGLKLHSLGFLQSQCPSLVSMLINTLGVSMLTKQWPGKTLRAPPPHFPPTRWFGARHRSHCFSTLGQVTSCD